MSYIDQTYFTEHSDVSIDASEFALLNERAEDIINGLTSDLQGYALEDLSVSTQTRVKKAVVIQIEALYYAGGLESMSGASINGATIGKFSYSGGNNTDVDLLSNSFIKTLLGPTGLLYRGVDMI